MKKIVKMSLVTAVTLAGFSSNVSANTLTEVASNFDVFGYALVRYDDSDINGSSYSHKEVLGASGKLTDDISYMFAGANLEIDKTNAKADYSGLLMVYNYFTYTGLKNTSISIGKVGVDSPLTVVYYPASATSEANGLNLTSKLGPVTLNAAYFANTNFHNGDKVTVFPGTVIDGGESYTHVGLSGKAGPVSIDAWYAQMENRYDSYTIGLTGNINVGSATVTPYARYTAADIDGSNLDQSLWKAGVKVKAGIVGGELAYGQTDTQGGWVTFDENASANLRGWNVGLLGNADAKLTKASLNVDVMPKVNLSATYVDMEIGAAPDQKEMYATVKYQITKGLSAYVRMGQLEVDGMQDETVGRANILWLF